MDVVRCKENVSQMEWWYICVYRKPKRFDILVNLADATSTKFYSKDEYLQHTDASALPYTLADFANNGGSDPFSLTILITVELMVLGKHTF